MKGKVQASGRRVFSKAIRNQMKEIQSDNLDLLIEASKPMESLEKNLDFLKRRKENTEKQIRIVEMAIEQQLTFETYLDHLREIKEALKDEKYPDDN